MPLRPLSQLRPSLPMMLDPNHPLLQLVRNDRRYKLEAYQFVYESLAFAQEKLGLGHETPHQDLEAEPSDTEAQSAARSRSERHLTGQELCEAARLFALDQYGYMARCVLANWGITSTSDIGEIVFSLIRIRQMRKTKRDRREDFDNVFDFETGFNKDFQITVPK